MPKHKTPPAPTVIAETLTILRDTAPRIERLRRVPDDTREKLQWCVGRISPHARQVLPEGIDVLPLLSEKSPEGNSIGEHCATTRRILERALKLIDLRQQEKVPFSDDEMQQAELLRSIPTNFASIACIWDLDLKRLDEACHEHRWLPEDWDVVVRGQGTNVRRTVARKESRIVAGILSEPQRERKQDLLLNVVVHPALPECADELLDRYLLGFAEQPWVVMAVRERRQWLYELLGKKGFIAGKMLRNHYRYQTTYGDAYLMERYREGR